ncbi:hypothetical protein BCV69DRAFT_272775 [Microstroma glucosiphilum]|uniref:SSD domain-containing protein n=1 Tax=Pseudomicrostroma glucosiphilum TaxID=1684307 RepID=A0A316U3H2_9BASI|nr:hypothetical protein BCV69DRAFT_272775 [Pseudomicrostroma glucosiphilum]PWN18903.1 hypothetical protein BCV69DRAFT_272775 [Pseudomicrostroma glucosiphilum]
MTSSLVAARPAGRCNMRGDCGKASLFSPSLPCALDEAQAEQPDDELRASLTSLCGSAYAQGPVCCTAPQVEALAANLQRAEALISSCPACRNNFRGFFCTFTCSPNQSQFLDISSSQKTGGGEDGDTAVKSVEYWVTEDFKRGFFDSCKNVKFGASNGFAMDLIGGGAKEADEFLKYMGDEKPLLGSPFQINFPHADAAATGKSSGSDQTPSNVSFSSSLPALPFEGPARGCADPDLSSRCACTDCPEVCTVLPHLDPPQRGVTCRVGAISCYSFALVIIYALGLVAAIVGYGAGKRIKSRRHKRIGIRHRTSGISVASEGSGYERVRLSTEDEAEGSLDHSPQSSNGGRGENVGLLGARGLGGFDGEEESNSSAGAGPHRGRGLGSFGSGSIDALGTTQPRTYALQNVLTSFFYKLGLLVTRAPLLTFAISLIFLALCNLGWSSFRVETDPVRLWVAPNSESKLQKEYFDEHFGPFYRTQQIFLMDKEGKDFVRTPDHLQRLGEIDQLPAALNFERLQWMQDLEAEISSLQSKPSGYRLRDVCFAPTGAGKCVVQSVLGYFQNDLDGAGVDGSNWKDAVNSCAGAPAECLPIFGAPMKSNVILGAIPESISEPVQGGNAVHTRPGEPSDARSAVITYVVNNSLNKTEVAIAEEWERALEDLLFSIAGINNAPVHPLGVRRQDLGLELAISTESSLQQELGSSSNTDGPTIVASYLLMFLYAAMTLGGGTASGIIADRIGSNRAATSRANQAAPHGAALRTGLAGRIMGFMPSRASSGQRRAASQSMSSSSFNTRIMRRFFVNSKFTLGLFGIVIVLASVSSAIGLLSAMGVSTTLIIAEVLPFLVLAVGVDNIFLLSNEMDRQSTLSSTANPYSSASLARSGMPPAGLQGRESLDIDSTEEGDDDDIFGGPIDATPQFHLSSSERAARALSRMGPSILLSATTQITAFLLGAIVPMPAVRNFALYAAFSMFIVFVLQCTCFVAAMKLDADRTESSRVDCLPCFRLSGAIALGNGAGSMVLPHASEGVLGRFIRRYYAATLVKPFVKRIVLVLFSGLFVLSLIGARKVEMGLDQRLALPTTSYLRDYFNSLDAFLDVGPPVYFVARQVDPSHRKDQQALCGRFTTCHDLSLANVLEGERKRPAVSFLAEPASSWVDDFFTYLNPVLESCCRVKKADPMQFCLPRDPESRCQPCFQDRAVPWNITLEGMPQDEEFMRYLEHWLQAPTNEDCPLGGQASYSAALSIVRAAEADKNVVASHFRTYHTPLRSQADFIDALKSAHRISADITSANSVGDGAGEVELEVFPYSIFYVFFDQYLHLIKIATVVLGGSLLSIFAITTLLLGSWRTGLVVTISVISALTGVVGFMGIAGIGFNALTLVNLSVCAAICVEFQAHVAKSFMKSPSYLPRGHPMAQKARDERAWSALSDVGGSVLSGITGTKLVGISVLAFTRSELLRLYYARMWLALILLGATHGLILLPVLLSYFGGAGYASHEDEGEVRHRLLRAQDTAEYRPFAGDEEEEEEDEDEEAGSVDSREGRY